jgi:hypothetical protein
VGRRKTCRARTRSKRGTPTAKSIDLGVAKEKSPISSSGVQIYGTPSRPSPKPTPIRAGFPPPEQCTALLGAWEVKYPGPDEMIQDDYSERLELKGNGTFTWTPPPPWAMQTGNWSVEIRQDSTLRLCFENKWGGFRCHYLVLIQMRKGGPFFLHWTRTRGDVVIFADRIFRADRPNNNAPNR